MRDPLELSIADLKARPSVTTTVTMECAGNGRARLSPRPISQPWLGEAVGTAEWTGTPLRPLLEEAGPLDEAVELVFAGADRGIQKEIEHDYERSLPIADALRDEVLLAYEMNGAPLPPQHGFPLRLVVPGWYGMTSVKWLTRITAVREPFEGFQQLAYRYRQEPEDDGTPVTRMDPRSLMIPPGIPDFLTRSRIVDAGHHVLRGRAWSGWGPIERVEVSADGGSTWATAELGDAVSPYAWRSWSFDWDARARRRRALLPGGGRGGQRAAARAVVEPRRVLEQRGAARLRRGPPLGRSAGQSSDRSSSKQRSMSSSVLKKCGLIRRPSPR